MRLLGLYAKQGRGRMESQIRKLSEDAKAHPDDAEATLFLAHAQERAGDATGAMRTLRELLARTTGGGPGPDAAPATSRSRRRSGWSTCSSGSASSTRRWNGSTR